MKPTNSPTKGQPNPRKNGLKVGFGPLLYHNKLFFRGLGLILYRKQTTRNPTQPNSPQATYVVVPGMLRLKRPRRVKNYVRKIERRTSGVCGARLNLHIHARHVCLGTYTSGRESGFWLKVEPAFRRDKLKKKKKKNTLPVTSRASPKLMSSRLCMPDVEHVLPDM